MKYGLKNYKSVFDKSTSIQKLIEAEYKLCQIDEKTNTEYKNICYFKENYPAFTITDVMKDIKNNDVLEERIVTKIDIIKENNKYKNFFFNSDVTISEIKRKLLNEIKLENGFPTFVYPFIEGGEFYYQHESKLILLKPEETIRTKINLKDNLFKVKFQICAISDSLTEYYLKVFGSDDILSTIRKAFHKESSKIYVYKVTETMKSSEEDSLSELKTEFIEIKEGETFEQARIHYTPIIHFNLEKPFE